MTGRRSGGARAILGGLVVLAVFLGGALPAGAAKPARAAAKPPTVAITSPTAGATVSGTVAVSGTASDDVGLSSVRVAVDGGAPVAVTGTGSWTWTWATSGLANGSHVLTASATDTSGLTASTSVTVSVANPTADTTAPSVAITAPASGSTLSGTAMVAGTASDTSGVASVEVAIDGGPWAMASGTSSWSWSWATATAANGSHTITTRARDGAGNTSTATRSVSVSNVAADSTPPSVAITAPAGGSTVSGNVTVTGTAGDAGGLVKVEVAVDGGPYATASGTSSWSWGWSTTSLANGSHSLVARATDAAGNTATAGTTVTVGNTSAAPATQGTWVSPEGVTISISSAGPWTIARIYELLKANALDLDEVGPRLTIVVQDTAASTCTSSASTSGGVYSSYSARITLQGVNSRFATSPDRAMAHEYGHAWTMYHLYMTHQGDWSSYLDQRWTAADGSTVLATDSRLDSSYSWTRGEIVAEDYRLLFGSSAAVSQAPTHMNTAITDPRNQPGLRDWFLQHWG